MTKKHYLVDLHTHLNEKKIKPKDWWKAVKEKKLCGVAITEHVEYDPELAYKKLKSIQPRGVILLPGMEAKTTAGHLLIYGTNESIYKIPKLQNINLPIEEALKIIKKNNLTASFAHPYGYKTDSTCLIIGEKKTKQLLKKYKIGTEYYNGMLGSANGLVFGSKWIKRFYAFFNIIDKRQTTRILTLNSSTKIKTQLENIALETLDRVRKAIIFSENAAYITVGSDAHYPRTIGSSVIQLKKQPKNEAELIQMIKKKEILWAGPNVFTTTPVDHLKRKELLEGVKYIATHKIKKTIKPKKLKKPTKKKIEKIKQKINTKSIKKITKKIPGKKIVFNLKKKIFKGKKQ
ncbi:MAG: hypothetical protein GX950_03055 [Candidatus Diapherotrites archaeon]|jgi:hypothetical protein|uniref:PHP domain-containing protein n=1 Tax=Candidatus Iainarchaeum sp. TaxID=3101447 RepID=A0A7K4BZS5_9ARCH|nr:hypothetical protein [Candidatus Diapherotrites archaeon]